MLTSLLSILPIPVFEYQSKSILAVDEKKQLDTWIIVLLLVAAILVSTITLGSAALLTLASTTLAITLTALLMMLDLAIIPRLPVNRILRVTLSTLLTVSPVTLIILFIMLAGTYSGLFTVPAASPATLVTLIMPAIVASLLPLSQGILLMEPPSNGKTFLAALAFSMDHAGWMVGVILIAEVLLKTPGTSSQILAAISAGNIGNGLLALLLYFSVASLFSLRASAIRTVFSLRDPEDYPDIEDIPRGVLITLSVLGVVGIIGLVAVFIMPSVPPNPLAIYDLPSAGYPLGTDQLGRNLLPVSLLSISILVAFGLFAGIIIAVLDHVVYDEERVIVYLDVIWMAFEYALLLSIFIPAQQSFIGLWAGYQNLLSGVQVPSGGFFYRIAAWYALLTLVAGVVVYLPYALAATTPQEAKEPLS